MENDATREERQALSPAVQEYREAINNGEDESDVAHKVADKWGISMRDLRERAKAGA